MSEIKIKCPTCGKVLRLPETPNINAASFTCPVCHERHVVGQCQRYVPAPPPPTATEVDKTRYDDASPTTEQPGGDKTRHSGSPAGPTLDVPNTIGPAAQPTVGMLVDANGASYQLTQGFNGIGRKANNSAATVKIATTDRTMSRCHAIIEVQSAGGHLLHILKNWENKNPTFLNDMQLAPGDQLILNPGDRLKMGNTILTFKK